MNPTVIIYDLDQKYISKCPDLRMVTRSCVHIHTYMHTSFAAFTYLPMINLLHSYIMKETQQTWATGLEHVLPMLCNPRLGTKPYDYASVDLFFTSFKNLHHLLCGKAGFHGLLSVFRFTKFCCYILVAAFSIRSCFSLNSLLYGFLRCYIIQIPSFCLCLWSLLNSCYLG